LLVKERFLRGFPLRAVLDGVEHEA
jgi:hypothetical protein